MYKALRVYFEGQGSVHMHSLTPSFLETKNLDSCHLAKNGLDLCWTGNNGPCFCVTVLHHKGGLFEYFRGKWNLLIPRELARCVQPGTS